MTLAIETNDLTRFFNDFCAFGFVPARQCTVVFSRLRVGSPLSSAKSISVNLTVTQETAAGSLAAYAGNGTPNGTSSISFAAGATRANNAIVCLSTDGAGSIGVENDAAGTVHFILDVNGYFQ